MKRPRHVIAILAATLLLVPGLAACGATHDAKVELSAVKGFTPVPGKPLGPATGSLQQTDGSTWTYTKPAAGKITLVFFGFTHCEDECPTTMTDLASALKRVPESVASKVAVEFVSVDPDRDTIPALQRYVRRFDPAFLAGRAPIGQVVTDAFSYGISVTAPTPATEKGDYEVEHGLQVAVLDQHGGEVGFFAGLAGAKAYAAALPALVEKYA